MTVQIATFIDESQANSFMKNVDVINVLFIGKTGYTGKKWAVIYKKEE